MKNYWWYILLISIVISVVWKMFGATAPFYVIIIIVFPLLGFGGQLLLIIAGVIFSLYEKIIKKRGDDKESKLWEIW